MTPNVSVLLQRWGVDKVIGENLVQFEELNMRRKDGTRVGHTEIGTLEKTLGRPWWVVHRMHLFSGLATVAQDLGANIIIDSTVIKIDYKDTEKVKVETQKGAQYTFDLLIGADGINSITRKTLFPDISPEPPTTNCAYRALVPYEQIRKDPIAKELIEKLTMEVWMAENAYIITYPINAGNMFNLVLSHHRPEKLRATEPDVPIEELWNEYQDFDPRIKRIVNMIDKTVRNPYGHVPYNHGHSTNSYAVKMATHGDWTVEVVVITEEERGTYGRCCSFHGQSYGSRGGYIYGRWSISG